MTLRIAHQQFVTKAQVRAADNCACVTDAVPADADLDALIDAASDAIAQVTGMKVAGRRQLVARPCRVDFGVSACGCCGLDGIPLGDERPVVDSVTIDGVTIDPATYDLHHDGLIGWRLVKVSTDSTRPTRWPSAQARWKPATETDTFAVTFTGGFDVDHYLVESAALEIVCDFAADNLVAPNALPDGTTSVSIANTTIIIDPDQVERIRTGAFGPMTSRMMGVLAPAAATRSTVWAPELADGWDLGLRLP